ncbi:hypothetical protein cyc_00134 [Cyclospora cayetanensis]|uniref:Uncharacterized protein n=1 Tax=Cyclospora cayetanensis TaxID=88456 RepID=A0A1D3D9Z4_9EIME|nr:hypothetical protein cyc_00134 [Cyclospora cayetanensis]
MSALSRRQQLSVAGAVAQESVAVARAGKTESSLERQTPCEGSIPCMLIRLCRNRANATPRSHRVDAKAIAGAAVVMAGDLVAFASCVPATSETVARCSSLVSAAISAAHDACCLCCWSQQQHTKSAAACALTELSSRRLVCTRNGNRGTAVSRRAVKCAALVLDLRPSSTASGVISSKAEKSNHGETDSNARDSKKQGAATESPTLQPQLRDRQASRTKIQQQKALE